MKKTSDLVKMAVAVFLIIAGIIFLVGIGGRFDFADLSDALYSVVVSFAILLFTIVSGTFYLASSNKVAGERLMVISLFIQAFPFSIFGVTCINFLGAFIGPQVTIAPSITMSFQLSLLTGAIRNSFQFSMEVFYFGINIFPLFLIWLMRHLTREEKRVAEVNTVLQRMDSFKKDDREEPR